MYKRSIQSHQAVAIEFLTYLSITHSVHFYIRLSSDKVLQIRNWSLPTLSLRYYTCSNHSKIFLRYYTFIHFLWNFATKNHNVWRTLTFTKKNHSVWKITLLCVKNTCLLNVIVLFRFAMGGQITFTPVVILLVKIH